MKNINIPEPCSENWNEMTLNEKGAFCQKCALDVYDFTSKSGDEIRDILTLNIGSRVCGRIEPTQLAELNHDFSAWQINNKQSYQRAWLFTLFVVFGMTLFSCEEDEVPVVEKFQKTAQSVLTEDPISDSSNDEMKTLEVNKQGTEQRPIKGEIVQDPEPEIMLLGEFVSDFHRDIPEEDSLIVEDYPQPVGIMMGAMISTRSYTDHLISEPLICSADTVVSGIVYPNPANNETTLKLNLPNKCKGEIELLSMNGQRIRTIHNGRLKKGETEFPIDLTDLETGIYLVIIVADGKKETVKFTKI